MKQIFFLAILFFSSPVFSQDRMISISVKTDSLTVSLEEDNSDKIIRVNSNNVSPSDEMLFSVLFWKDETDWKRTVTVEGEDGAEVFSVPAKGKKGFFCAKLNTVMPLLEKGKTYSVYTVALPKDPKLAMVVKVPRILVCKIEAE